MNLNNRQKGNIKRAATLIISSFPWNETEQGFKYWQDVYYNLHKIRGSKEKEIK